MKYLLSLSFNSARIYRLLHKCMRTVAGQTLSRSYGRCIAEFLNEGSPEHLGLLDLSTCVGLRYGRRTLLTYVFSCQFGPREFRSYDQFHSCLTESKLSTTYLDGYGQQSARVSILRQHREHVHRYRNINLLSIAYATRLGLGPTNPGTITVAQETLLFRWAGFSPALWLLIPAFSLPCAPPDLTI